MQQCGNKQLIAYTYMYIDICSKNFKLIYGSRSAVGQSAGTNCSVFFCFCMHTGSLAAAQKVTACGLWLRCDIFF